MGNYGLVRSNGQYYFPEHDFGGVRERFTFPDRLSYRDVKSLLLKMLLRISIINPPAPFVSALQTRIERRIDQPLQ